MINATKIPDYPFNSTDVLQFLMYLEMRGSSLIESPYSVDHCVRTNLRLFSVLFIGKWIATFANEKVMQEDMYYLTMAL